MLHEPTFKKRTRYDSRLVAGWLLIWSGIALITQATVDYLHTLTQTIEGYLVWFWFGADEYSTDQAIGSWLASVLFLTLALIILKLLFS